MGRTVVLAVRFFYFFFWVGLGWCAFVHASRFLMECAGWTVRASGWVGGGGAGGASITTDGG